MYLHIMYIIKNQISPILIAFALFRMNELITVLLRYATSTHFSVLSDLQQYVICDNVRVRGMLISCYIKNLFDM